MTWARTPPMPVIPAKAGIHFVAARNIEVHVDSRLRGNDDEGRRQMQKPVIPAQAGIHFHSRRAIEGWLVTGMRELAHAGLPNR